MISIGSVVRSDKKRHFLYPKERCVNLYQKQQSMTVSIERTPTALKHEVKDLALAPQGKQRFRT